MSGRNPSFGKCCDVGERSAPKGTNANTVCQLSGVVGHSCDSEGSVVVKVWRAGEKELRLACSRLPLELHLALPLQVGSHFCETLRILLWLSLEPFKIFQQSRYLKTSANLSMNEVEYPALARSVRPGENHEFAEWTHDTGLQVHVSAK
ncbi:MAG: hypothetical protein JW940_12635 [Polyangiaceae bacterium]|nr:hypothetical protein [Polyangiaceae bacterium]